MTKKYVSVIRYAGCDTHSLLTGKGHISVLSDTTFDPRLLLGLNGNCECVAGDGDIDGGETGIAGDVEREVKLTY